MDIVIRSASAHDLEEVKGWLVADRNMDYSGRYDPNRTAIRLDSPEDTWVAERGGELVAYAAFDVNRAQEAYIGFVVKPDVRRQGIAKEFIPRLLEHQDIKRYSKIIGTHQMGDTATEKILRRAGFYETGYDQNGMIVYERR